MQHPALSLLGITPDSQPAAFVPQRTPEWHALRRNVMTASRIGWLYAQVGDVVLAEDEDTSKGARDVMPEWTSRLDRHQQREVQDTFAKMAGLVDEDSGMPEVGSYGRKRIDFGVQNESWCLNMVQQRLASLVGYWPHIFDLGLLVDPMLPWRGASLDGLVVVPPEPLVFHWGLDRRFMACEWVALAVEAKCQMRRSEPWTGPRDYHTAQMDWQVMVLDAAMADSTIPVAGAIFVGYSPQHSCVEFVPRSEERESRLALFGFALKKAYDHFRCAAGEHAPLSTE